MDYIVPNQLDELLGFLKLIMHKYDFDNLPADSSCNLL